MRTESSTPNGRQNKTSMKNMNYKKAIRSPEVFRLLFEAINGQDLGELAAERHSPDMPKPWALSLYHSQDGAIPYFAGVFKDLDTIETMAQMVAHEIVFYPRG